MADVQVTESERLPSTTNLQPIEPPKGILLPTKRFGDTGTDSSSVMASDGGSVNYTNRAKVQEGKKRNLFTGLKILLATLVLGGKPVLEDHLDQLNPPKPTVSQTAQVPHSDLTQTADVTISPGNQSLEDFLHKKHSSTEPNLTTSHSEQKLVGMEVAADPQNPNIRNANVPQTQLPFHQKPDRDSRN